MFTKLNAIKKIFSSISYYLELQPVLYKYLVSFSGWGKVNVIYVIKVYNKSNAI